MTDTDQTEAFPGAALDAQPPEKRWRWYCTRCGSELVYGVSMLDTSMRYAIAARCGGCKKRLVTIQRDIPRTQKGPSSDA